MQAPEPAWASLDASYLKDVKPLLKQYCQRCHSGKHPEAEIDLEHFATLDAVRKSPRVWQRVLEMLDTAQMPPMDAKQPNAAERTKLQTWVRDYLKLEARAQAGDPGKVTLRRLSNAEYTYTVRDLTGVDTLQPAKEFPVDGAAGEGFTNTGDALAMSPALFVKYLDAAKRIAKHAVLLPDGIRFSPHTTRQDWTNDVLAEIRAIYGAYSDSNASSQVKLQGLVWDTKQGGRLPIEKYLHATLAERAALQSGTKSIDVAAKERALSPKYLGLVWARLNDRELSLLLDLVRARWREAKPDDAAALAVEISRWQGALWKFGSVGHIGKVGGPKAWMEPIDPLVAKQDLRVKIAPTSSNEVTLYLSATNVGAGNDYVVWQSPRLVAPGRADIPLKDLRAKIDDLTALRAELFADTEKYLRAVDEAAGIDGKPDLAALARKHAVAPPALAAWLDYVGVGSGPAKVVGHFTKKLPASAAFKAIQGWGTSETPLVVANSSDDSFRIPGTIKPHSVAVHPSPKLNAVVGWQSSVAGKVRIEAKVVHAHPECGDGVSFTIELRRGATRQRLAAGIAQGAKEPKIDPIDIGIKQGDLISIVIGPRANHACDMTAVDLTLSVGDKSWDLAKDVSDDLLAANPHADRFGNKSVWHFYTEPVAGASDSAFVMPHDSVLDRWRSATTPDEKARLAAAVQKLLTAGAAEFARFAGRSPVPPTHGVQRSAPGPLARCSTAQKPKDDGSMGPRSGVVRPSSAWRRQSGRGELVCQGAICRRDPPACGPGRRLRIGDDWRPARRSRAKASVQLQVLAARPAANDLAAARRADPRRPGRRCPQASCRRARCLPRIVPASGVLHENRAGR